ncbi:MAG: aminotransferase class I/II-fold pyridoxal phosphate-dependent enzyme [Phycisphaeraceae bacterium]|nr:aminotransferase class I/II-fold pyridoxal phosphate-dependent enzyme [Phycisphaeraceae bacterium]
MTQRAPERRSPHGTVARLAPFGESVFARISRMAVAHNAVNLGQGFPNFDGPEFVKEAAIRAIREGFGQYARSAGLPVANAAIAERWRESSGFAVDPDTEVTVTAGCTEAIAAAILGLVEPGDEVILVEPFYDSYAASVAMAGGVVRTVRLEPPDFSFPVEALRRAISPKTRLLLLNTPHNPTGRVLSAEELSAIADLAQRHDFIVISDEVYEKLVYEGTHRSIATLPGMRERTVVLSSLGKTFSLTGWKIGWSIAPPHLTSAVRAAHQFLTFAAPTPLQRAAADALHAPPEYYEQLRSDYFERRRVMLEELRSAGFEPFVPEGSYFVIADHRHFGFPDDERFCEHLITEVGVAAIPCSAFYAPPAERGLVRFAFCKTPETMREAGARMRERLRPQGVSQSIGRAS